MTQVEGRNPVLELLRSGASVEWIQIAQGLERNDVIQEILRLAEDQEVQVELVPRGLLKKRSTTGREQGVIAFVASPKYVTLDEILEPHSKNIFVVVLDRVQDPHNLGSILRTADATGVDVVVVPKRESVGITPTVHRASMGGSNYVPVARENIHNSLKLLSEEGVRIVAVDPSGPSDYFEVNLTGSLALVFGGEDKGIGPSLLKRCGSVIRIPMMGHLESLNVGVTAALVMYERVRQLKSETKMTE